MTIPGSLLVTWPPTNGVRWSGVYGAAWALPYGRVKKRGACPLSAEARGVDSIVRYRATSMSWRHGIS